MIVGYYDPLGKLEDSGFLERLSEIGYGCEEMEEWRMGIEDGTPIPKKIVSYPDRDFFNGKSVFGMFVRDFPRTTFYIIVGNSEDKLMGESNFGCSDRIRYYNSLDEVMKEI